MPLVHEQGDNVETVTRALVFSNTCGDLLQGDAGASDSNCGDDGDGEYVDASDDDGDVADDDDDGPQSPILEPRLARQAVIPTCEETVSAIRRRHGESDALEYFIRRLQKMSVVYATSTHGFLGVQRAKYESKLQALRTGAAETVSGLQGVVSAQRCELDALQQQFDDTRAEHSLVVERAAKRAAAQDSEIARLQAVVESLRKQHSSELRKRAKEADERLDQLGRLLGGLFRT
jgi:hypothetical protein